MDYQRKQQLERMTKNELISILKNLDILRLPQLEENVLVEQILDLEITLKMIERDEELRKMNWLDLKINEILDIEYTELYNNEEERREELEILSRNELIIIVNKLNILYLPEMKKIRLIEEILYLETKYLKMTAGAA